MTNTANADQLTSFGAPAKRCAVGALLRFWALRRPRQVCCALDDHLFTFAEIDRRADQLAAGLAALGIGKGDRVATLAPNRVETLELFYALARAGAIQVPLNAYLKGDFLRHQITHCKAEVLITDEAGEQAVRPHLHTLPELETIILLDGHPDARTTAGRRRLPYSVIAEANGPAPEVQITPEDPMSIVYTSGTTGLPKGCVLSHGYYCRSGQLNGDALELTDRDVLFSSLPLFHGGGRLIVLMGALYRGLPVRVESAFSASGFFRRAAQTESTVAIGVGAMGAALLAAPPSPHDRDHRLRTMMVAPMSPAAQMTFRERFGIEPWTEVFGQTECMPVTITPISSSARDRGSGGAPARDLDVALLDDEGRPVKHGATGEICVRPKDDRFAMFDGYWDQPEETLQAFRGLWYHTGDCGRWLPSGSLAFVDRKKDALRRRGENVSSIELETAITTHPDIIDCAVHAVPSELAEDDIKACVVLREQGVLDPEPLFHYLKDNLPYYAIPRYIEIVDSLPRNAVGRVRKDLLRERKLAENVWDFTALGLTVARDERR